MPFILIPFGVIVQLSATQNRVGGGGLSDNNSSTVEIENECGHCKIFQGATMQRASYDKMTITNRDKKYYGSNCYVLEENKGSKKDIEEWGISGVNYDYIT